ncbi:hypothetical protein MBANPS3_008373 [Mucor bainieri]
MVFASLKNKLVSVADAIINQVCYAVSASIAKTAQDVLPTPQFRAYGFLEDVYQRKFQLAKDEGFCIVEELSKIPVNIFRACRSDMPRKDDSPQLYRNMPPYQHMLADQHADERNFDFVEYPDFLDETITAKQPTQETNPNFNKKNALKSLKSKLRRLSQNSIHSFEDLTQCRLVCTRWNQLAERAMFARPIFLPSISRAKAFLRHLQRNPQMGKLVTYLDLGIVKNKHVHVYLDLLPIVFTPAIHTLQGSINAPVFYRHLVSIAKASDTRFSKLKVIPTQLLRGSKDFYKAVYYFRKTLQQLYISWYDPSQTPWHVFNRLNEMSRLTVLTIDSEVSSVLTLDRMLSNCKQVRILNVMLLGVMPQVMPKARLLNWMEIHVEKVPSVTNLFMEKSRQPDVIEYLLYKYPNVKEVTVILSEPEYYEEQLHLSNGAIWVEDGEPNTEAIHRIIGAMQKVPYYRIRYMDHIYNSVMEAIESDFEFYDQGKVTWKDGPSPGWMEVQVRNRQEW